MSPRCPPTPFVRSDVDGIALSTIAEANATERLALRSVYVNFAITGGTSLW